MTTADTRTPTVIAIEATFDKLKALHDEAWDMLCDAATKGTFADLIVVGALRRTFLLELRAALAAPRAELPRERAAFEDWAIGCNLSLVMVDRKTYDAFLTQCAWQAWLAAKAAP